MHILKNDLILFRFLFFFLKQRFTNDRQGMYNIKDNNKNSCKTKIQSASFLFQVVEKTS
jgi:hypothetical protein